MISDERIEEIMAGMQQGYIFSDDEIDEILSERKQLVAIADAANCECNYGIHCSDRDREMSEMCDTCAAVKAWKESK